ncbi:deubiquitination-protection protein dph1 [Metarhizium album ARSEF 1941]|uniref:Deubiquitination-protection protein dph1 n=1 Tax=Metarhizium album (strain ARSEF 1941) TaxID=1081103 RepID=A0A0B2WZB8_METAS|nr:deubiquitination-protection protein dph1 [Metarhizium album ARSEF 1941]KHN98924.1 deubiquitination-protection protein dph1 [Metarhizium album ARSEF 1941]
MGPHQIIAVAHYFLILNRKAHGRSPQPSDPGLHHLGRLKPFVRLTLYLYSNPASGPSGEQRPSLTLLGRLLQSQSQPFASPPGVKRPTPNLSWSGNASPSPTQPQTKSRSLDASDRLEKQAVVMADNVETSGDKQVTFKVKTSSDRNHTITMAESATVLELKTKLAGGEFEDIPVQRQRLIYSGRVMKNDDTLGSYSIKQNNTIHMVKSAASNPTQQTSTSGPTPRAVPDNISAGTSPNDPLANLTGARYAGHQINFPGMDMFGPDGGMGPPMDEERIQRMMSDPNVQQSMNEALNNPDFVNMLIESNPMLRNMPNAREIITSPFMRQMMSSPQMMNQAMRMQRSMRGGYSAFPAPGATDTTPDAAAGGNRSAGQARSPMPNPILQTFMMPGTMGGAGGAGGTGGNSALNFAQMLQSLNAMSPSPAAQAPTTSPPTAGATQGTTPSSESREGQGAPPDTGAAAGASLNNQTQSAANPFAALFSPAANPDNLWGANADVIQQMMQMFGGAGAGSPASPPDNRPPEERYADQLRQLNDMGFCDFDRNVAALRRSGGSVQGAVEHLLSATD